MLTIYCDGGSRGNPGPAASAFVVFSGSIKICEGSKHLGTSTNNVAEYTALLMALRYLAKEKVEGDVRIVLDSQLVTRQMQGSYKVKNERLIKLFLEAKKIEGALRAKVVYSWSAREGNKEADALVNKTLDGGAQ